MQKQVFASVFTKTYEVQQVFSQHQCRHTLSSQNSFTRVLTVIPIFNYPIHRRCTACLTASENDTFTTSPPQTSQSHLGRAHCHLLWYRMHSPTSCTTSREMPTADKSNHSQHATSKLQCHMRPIHYIALSNSPPPRKKIWPFPHWRH